LFYGSIAELFNCYIAETADCMRRSSNNSAIQQLFSISSLAMNTDSNGAMEQSLFIHAGTEKKRPAIVPDEKVGI